MTRTIDLEDLVFFKASLRCKIEIQKYYQFNKKLFVPFPQEVWMWIFGSMLFVSVSLILCLITYKKLFPGIRLISIELVLIPFRL